MGFLDRFRRTPPTPPAATVPAGPPPPEQVAALEELLDDRAGAGFWTYDDTAEWVGDVVCDDPETFAALDATSAQGVVDSWWERRLRLEATWSGDADDARLEAAFAELERKGITARMNFACCQTCGHAEIGDEAGDDARGYTFFHEQDAEELAPGASSLYLAFGAFATDASIDPQVVDRAAQGDDDARREMITASERRIAGEVVTTLVAHGLVTEWDGTCEQRIHLPQVDWRRRLPAR